MSNNKVDLRHSLGNLMDLMNENIKALKKQNTWANTNPKISDVLYTTNQMNHLKYVANKFPITRQLSDQSSTTTSSSHERLNLKNYNGVIIRENFKGGDYLSNGIINANPTNLKKKNKVTFSQDTNYYDVDMKTPRWDKYWWGAMGRCMKCSKATTPLDAIQIGDRSWHTWCLKCEHCWMTLDNKSSVKLFQGNVFCPRCYANLLTTLKVAPWKSPFFFSNPDLFNSIPARDSWFGPKYFSDHFHLWNKLTGNHIYENQDMIWEHYYSNGYDRFDLLHQKRFASTLLYENLDDPFLPYLPPGHFSPHFALTAPSRSVKPFVPPLPPPIGHSLPLIPASRGLPPPPPPISRLGGPPPPPISRLSRPPPPPISRHNRPPPPPLRRHSRPLLPPSSSRPPPIPNGYKAPPPPPPPPPPPMQRTSSNMVAQNSNNGAESKPTSSISSIVSTKKSLQRLSNGKFVMVKPAANQNGVNLNKATVFTKAAATWKSHIGGSTRAAEKLEDFGGPSSKTHTYVNQEMIWKNNRITKKSNTNGNSTAVKTSPFHNKSNIKRTDSVVVNKPNSNNISNNAPKPINGRRVPPPAPVKKRPPPPPPPSRQVPPPPVPQNSYKHHLMDHYRYEQLQYLDWIQDEEELKEYFNRYHTYANAELFWKHTPSRVTTSVGPTNKHRQRNGAKNTPNASMEPLDELREKPNMGRKILQQPVYDANESLAEMNELKKRLMSPFNERPEESDDDSAKSSPKIVELESDTSTDDIKTPRKTKRKESESSYQSVMSSAQDAWMEEYGVPIAAENDKNKNWIENNKESTFVDTGFAKPNYSDNKNVIREEAFNLRGTNSLKRTILRQSKKTAEEKNKKLTSANEEILEKKNTWNRVFQQIKVTGEFKRRGQSAKNSNSNVDDQKPLSDFENDQKQVFEKLDSMLKDESRKMGEQFYTELHNNNNVITTSEPVKAKLPFRNIKKERSLTEINVSKERIPEENDVNHEMSQNDNDQPSEILEKSPRHPPPANRVLHRANTEAVTINHSNNQDTLSEQGTYKRKSVSFASPNMMRSNTIADIHVTDSEVEGIGDHFESSQRQDPLGESTTSIKNIPQINTSPSKTYNKSDVTARVNQLLNAKINKVLNRNNLNSNEPEIIDNGADNLNINFDANSPVNVDVRERANSSSSRSRSPSPNNAQRMSRTASPSLTNIPVTNSRSSSPSSHNIPMSPRNASQSPIAMPSENVRSNSPSLHNAQITSRSGSPAITQHSNNASPNASNENLSKTQNILANGNQDKKIMIAENDDPSDNIDVGFLDIHTSEDNSFYNEIEKEGLAERQGGILPPHRNSLGSDLDTYSSLMASQASSRYSPLITSTSKIISSISPAKHFTTDLVLIRKDETPTEEEKSSTLKHRRDDDAHLERSFGGDSNIVKTDENNNNNNNNKNIQEKKKLSKKLKFWKK